MAQPQEPAPGEIRTGREPGFWATLVRLGQEATIVVFVFALGWLMTTVMRQTHQEREWWARLLLNSIETFEVVSVVVVVGFEVVALCWEAGRSALRRIKEP